MDQSKSIADMFANQARPKKTFPFLSLPAELRTQIYELVLGNYTVHVDCCRHDCSCREDGTHKAYVCSNEVTDVEYHSTYRQPEGYTEENIHSLRRSLVRHQHRGDEQKHRPSLPLSILYVSRQIYREACAVTFQANTFAFFFPKGLNKFVRGLAPWQTKEIRKVLVYVDVYSVEKKFHSEWSDNINDNIATSLTGLHQLQVLIDAVSGDLSYETILDRDDLFHSDRSGLVLGLFAFRACANLTNVQVMINAHYLSRVFRTQKRKLEPKAISVQLRALESQLRGAILEKPVETSETAPVVPYRGLNRLPSD